MTSRLVDDQHSTETLDYAFDIRGQLQQITTGGSSIGQFLYDPDGQRIRARFNDNSGALLSDRYSLYHGLNLLSQYDISPGNTPLLNANYLINPLTSKAIGRTAWRESDNANNTLTWYHNDAQGSVLATSKRTQSIAARYDYDAWGNEVNNTDTSDNPIGYTGHQMDRDIGLIYANARYLDPDTGRFLSFDPFEGYDNKPISLHRYLYAYQNPLRYTDPDGEESVQTIINNAAEGCGKYSCVGWAALTAFYQVGTAGFAAVHDPIRDALDKGQVSESEYWTAGVGGGLAVAGASMVTGRLAAPAIQAARSSAGVVAIAATTGAVDGAVTDAIAQGSHIAVGLQDGYNLTQTVTSSLTGFAIGGVASGISVQVANRTKPNIVVESSTGTGSVVPNSSAVDNVARVTPKSMGVHSISENPQLLEMWTDSMKYLHSANTKGGDKYRAYLEAMSNGDVSKEVARAAYDEVAVQFRKRVKVAQANGQVFNGYDFERLHHWNWPIGNYAEDATNASKLFPVSHDTHMDVHKAATNGPHPTNSPINPINVLDAPPSSELPYNYFNLLEH